MREGLLEARRVLVVGAGTQPSPEDEADAPVGNGRAIAVQCAREGAAVVCADRDEGSARATAAMIEGEGGKSRVVVGRRAIGGRVRGDRRGRVAEGLDGGGLDGLVCNVGIGRGGGLAGTSADDWDTTFAVNLRSHFLLARARAPRAEPGRRDRVHQFGRRPPTRQPAPRVRRVEGRPPRVVPPRRARSRAPRRSGQRRRARADRHAARPQRVPRPPVARAHAGAARPAGHGLGGRVGRRRSCCRPPRAT